jgi:hypothetical protein
MLNKPTLKVNSWYVNEHRVLEQIAGPEVIAHLRDQEGEILERAYRVAILSPLVADWVRSRSIPRIEQLALAGELKEGVLFTCDATFRSKGVSSRSPNKQAALKLELSAFGEHKTLVVTFNTAGLTTESAWTALSGQPRVFVVGFIRQITEEEVVATPYVIGDLIQDFGTVQMPHRRLLEIRAESFDALRKIDFNERVAISELERLRAVPESRVKQTFASIFDIVDVQKDWGGERCDLYASNVAVGGKRKSCAFVFKGPAKFHPMELKDCGKNADQILRLYETDAEVLVLQHCHEVRASVRKTMEIFASGDLRRYRQFCIIDGFDTVRILKSQGPLPA